MKSIASRVAHLRKLSGLSGAELGRRAGLSRATVPTIESRDGTPEASTLIALARVTGAELAWLLSGEGSAPSAEKVRSAVSRRGKAA